MAEMLRGKVALVTGASAGIGQAIAIELGRRGALTALHYGKNRAGAEDTLSQIRASGGKGFVLGADLETIASLPNMFETFDRELEALGTNGLDILVNNAGVGAGGDIESTDEALYDHILNIDLKAPFFVTQHAVKRMPRGGSIINISSMVSIAAHPVCLAYATAKAGLNHFSRSLAQGLGDRNIRVNAVAPGATATDFGGGAGKDPELSALSASVTALGRVGQPQDIKGIVAFLASDEGAWITGETICCSGGMFL